ncbi:MAG: hypothetical protein AB7G75_24340 [Candidatus Binatia bacterium]
MKTVAVVKKTAVGLATCAALVITPLPLMAQETAPQQEGSGSHMGMQGMMEKHHKPGMMADMHKHHQEMEKMHKEMGQELQKQMIALREHSKEMEGISDEKQLLTELKKHQQMTDTLLSTMLEQREKMHAQMHEHHEQMRSKMGKEPPQKGSETKEMGEHEQHHSE